MIYWAPVPSTLRGAGAGAGSLCTQLMKEMEAQRGVATRPRSHSQAHYAPRPPASQPRILRAPRACPGSRTIKRMVQTLPPPTLIHAPVPLPSEAWWPRPQESAPKEGSSGREGARLGQARSGRVLGFPRSGDAGMLLPLQSPTSPPGPAQVCNWGARLSCVATGLRGEVGGRGEVREKGRSPAGATLRTATHAASPLRPAGLSSGGGGAGAGRLTAMPPGRWSSTPETQSYKEPIGGLQVPESSGRVPGRHAPGLGSGPPPPSQSCAGRPRRGGC